MPDPAVEPLAHIYRTDAGHWRTHRLDEHLMATARLAETFAAAFGNGDWGWILGLWHDLGKYRSAFQAYIRGASGFDAHLENHSGRVDHSSADALLTLERFGDEGSPGRLLAYAIAGHHAGLADWDNPDGGGSLSARLSPDRRFLLDETLSASLPDNIRNASSPSSHPPKGSDAALWTRMLFSCLVDADFLDTESFMRPARAELRRHLQPLHELQRKFDAYVQGLSERAEPTPVNRIRLSLLRRCLDAAQWTPGLFSVTVPTGSGKTLATTGFALHHAVRHNKRRVVYVIPYTSIIEQTAEVLRLVLGEEVVLEHHSNIEPERETPQARVAAENWDAPVIVTTAVQFFESLFAARPSRCRKLHNLVNAVIVLDEVQLLPPAFLVPILHVIDQLARHYGATIVLATATQPAFQARHTADGHFPGFQGVREIVPDPGKLHARLRRIQVELPQDFTATQTWDALAPLIQAEPAVLCIVNTRRDARALHRLLPHGTFYLSTYLCGAHRSAVLKTIRARLADNEEVRVVSTQLVEAGVDLDFPVVFRALSGLDSIAQAAGRCNREGRQPELGQHGRAAGGARLENLHASLL